MLGDLVSKRGEVRNLVDLEGLGKKLMQLRPIGLGRKAKAVLRWKGVGRGGFPHEEGNARVQGAWNLRS